MYLLGDMLFFYIFAAVGYNDAMSVILYAVYIIK